MECRFVRVHREVLENAVPGCVGEELADMFEYIGEFGYDGGDPSVFHPQSVSAFLSKSGTLSHKHNSLAWISRSILWRSTLRGKTGLKFSKLYAWAW